MDLDERTALRSRHVSIVFSLPLTLVEVVDKYVDAQGLDPANRVNSSQVVADLIRDGLRAAAARARGMDAAVDIHAETR